jgi:hypothetical protein
MKLGDAEFYICSLVLEVISSQSKEQLQNKNICRVIMESMKFLKFDFRNLILETLGFLLDNNSKKGKGVINHEYKTKNKSI